MITKTNNARDLARQAADTVDAGGNWKGAALLIAKQAADGRTACAAVLATMLELWDRQYPAYSRAHFAESVLTYAISGDRPARRHKEWIRAFYWLRDGTDGVTADYAQLITLRFCNSNVYAGLNAAFQLCAALYGRELEHSRITSEDGERGVFRRLRLLIDAMIGTDKPEAPAPRPFTVWIHDKDTSATGYADRPFICHVNANCGADIESDALQVYRQAHGLPAEGWQEFADLNNAYVFMVIAGHIPFTSITLDYDGLDETTLASAYAMQANK